MSQPDEQSLHQLQKGPNIRSERVKTRVLNPQPTFLFCAAHTRFVIGPTVSLCSLEFCPLAKYYIIIKQERFERYSLFPSSGRLQRKDRRDPSVGPLVVIPPTWN
jgi:hypothetical protein